MDQLAAGRPLVTGTRRPARGTSCSLGAPELRVSAGRRTLSRPAPPELGARSRTMRVGARINERRSARLEELPVPAGRDQGQRRPLTALCRRGARCAAKRALVRKTLARRARDELGLRQSARASPEAALRPAAAGAALASRFQAACDEVERAASAAPTSDEREAAARGPAHDRFFIRAADLDQAGADCLRAPAACQPPAACWRLRPAARQAGGRAASGSAGQAPTWPAASSGRK